MAPSRPLTRGRASSLLLGGEFPDGIDHGAFWESRVLPQIARATTKAWRASSAASRARWSTASGAWTGRCAGSASARRARKQADGSILVDGVVIDVTAPERRRRRSRTSSARSGASSTPCSPRSTSTSTRGAIRPRPASIDFESTDQATFLECRFAVSRRGGVARSGPRRRPADGGRQSSRASSRAIAGSCESASRERRTHALAARPLDLQARARGDVIVEGIVSDVRRSARPRTDLAEALAGAGGDEELEDARAGRRAHVQHRPAHGARQPPQLRAIARARGRAPPRRAVRPDPARRRPLQAHNDTYGHQAGDDVLVAVVARMRRCCPPDALLARWGGEEFTVLVRGVQSRRRPARGRRGHPRDRARRAPRRPAGARSRSRSRAGECSRASGNDIDELVHAADAAMYRAKQIGPRSHAAGRRQRERLRRRARAPAIAQSFAHIASIREGVPELHCAEVAELAGQIADAARPPGRDRAALPARRLAPRRRQDRDPRPRAREARAADRRGVGRDGHARGVRRAISSRGRRGIAESARRRPPPPRALGRHRLSGPARRHEHPDRGARRRGGRHLARDDARPRLPPRARTSRRRAPSCWRSPDRSSTRRVADALLRSSATRASSATSVPAERHRAGVTS